MHEPLHYSSIYERCIVNISCFHIKVDIYLCFTSLSFCNKSLQVLNNNINHNLEELVLSEKTFYPVD